MKTRHKHNKGFTLVEMLIVVAIIAVLVVVAIPIYSAQLEKSREQVCLNNRDTLRRLLYADMLLDNMEEAEFQALVAQHIADSDILCPSGGTISAEQTELGTAAAFCDKHQPNGGAYGMGAGVPRFNFKNAITAAKNAFLDNGGAIPGRINSTDNTSAAAQAMNQYFAENGILPAKSNIQSWTLVRKGNSTNYDCYWTETDITYLSSGTQVLVLKYNERDKTYTVGTMNVKSYNKEGGGSCKGLDDNQNTSWVEYPGQDKDSKASFETAYAIYEQAQSQQGPTP